MSDPILTMLLAEVGCPYADGTVDSVVWMLGYKAGVERAKVMVDAELYGEAPPPAPLPDWRTPPPRPSRAN